MSGVWSQRPKINAQERKEDKSQENEEDTTKEETKNTSGGQQTQRGSSNGGGNGGGSKPYNLNNSNSQRVGTTQRTFASGNRSQGGNTQNRYNQQSNVGVNPRGKTSMQSSVSSSGVQPGGGGEPIRTQSAPPLLEAQQKSMQAQQTQQTTTTSGYHGNGNSTMGTAGAWRGYNNQQGQQPGGQSSFYGNPSTTYNGGGNMGYGGQRAMYGYGGGSNGGGQGGFGNMGGGGMTSPAFNPNASAYTPKFTIEKAQSVKVTLSNPDTKEVIHTNDSPKAQTPADPGASTSTSTNSTEANDAKNAPTVEPAGKADDDSAKPKGGSTSSSTSDKDQDDNKAAGAGETTTMTTTTGDSDANADAKAEEEAAKQQKEADEKEFAKLMAKSKGGYVPPAQRKGAEASKANNASAAAAAASGAASTALATKGFKARTDVEYNEEAEDEADRLREEEERKQKAAQQAAAAAVKSLSTNSLEGDDKQQAATAAAASAAGDSNTKMQQSSSAMALGKTQLRLGVGSGSSLVHSVSTDGLQVELANGSTISYNEDQFSPANPEGKKQYDRTFLMSFKDLCTDKPEGLDIGFIKQASNDPHRGGRRHDGHGGHRNGKMRDGRGKRNDRYEHDRGERGDRRGGRRHEGDYKHHGGRKGGRKGGRRNRHENLEPVAPLVKSDNAWKAPPKKATNEEEELQLVLRKTKGLLNKLTWERFDALYEQIRDVGIEDAATLEGVIAEIFIKALDEPTWGPLYAELCARLRIDIPAFEVEEPTEEDPEATRQVTFKRLLLMRCQQAFEQREDVEDIEGYAEMNEEDQELARTKVKRQMLGNIRFIGELFKLEMLTSNIMHECVQKLLGSPDSNDVPDEADLECLAKLLTTIGKSMDIQEHQTPMNQYFAKVVALSKDKRLPSRVRFMLEDVVDLRRNKWVPRRNDNAPKTIAEVHREAAEAKRKELAELARASTGGRFGRRGGPGGSGGRPRKGGRKEDRRSSGNRGGGGGGGGKQWGHGGGRDHGGMGPGGKRTYGKGGRRGKRVELENSEGSEEEHESEEEGSGEEDNKGQQGSEEERVEEVKRKSGNLLSEYLNIEDIKEALLCIDELEAPDLLHVTVETMINQALEGKAKDVMLVGRLLVAMRKEKDIEPSVFRKGFEAVMDSLEEIMVDAPNAWRSLAKLMAECIMAGALPASFVAEAVTDVVEGGLAIKMIVQITMSIEDARNQAAACKFIRELGMKDVTDLEEFMPIMDRGTGELDSLLTNNELSYVQNAWDEEMMAANTGEEEEDEVDVSKELLAKLEAHESNDELIQWIQNTLDEEEWSSVEFAEQLTSVFVDFLAIECLPKSVFAAMKEPKPEVKENEKKWTNEYARLLKRFLGDGDDQLQKQVGACYGVQAIANKRAYPKGWANRMFTNLYEAELIYEVDAIDAWVNDSREEPGGKQHTLKEIEEFLEFVHADA